MPKPRLRIADEFVYDLASVTSPRILQEIKRALCLLAENPEMGSPNVRPSLRKAFGKGIRKINASTFVIIYRYDNNFLDVLACVYGPRVR